MIRVHALVPVKDFARAKSRLASVLSPAERARLAERMATHVLEVLSAAPEVSGITVLASSPEVERWARAQGLAARRDPEAARGLADVVDAGLAGVPRGHALVVMSDLPQLGGEDVSALVASLEGSHAVLALDALGEGTNGLLLPTPAPFPTCFGHADSAARHVRRANERGVVLVTRRVEGFALDVDEPSALASMPRGSALRDDS